MFLVVLPPWSFVLMMWSRLSWSWTYSLLGSSVLIWGVSFLILCAIICRTLLSTSKYIMQVVFLFPIFVMESSTILITLFSFECLLLVRLVLFLVLLSPWSCSVASYPLLCSCDSVSLWVTICACFNSLEHFWSSSMLLNNLFSLFSMNFSGSSFSILAVTLFHPGTFCVFNHLPSFCLFSFPWFFLLSLQSLLQILCPLPCWLWIVPKTKMTNSSLIIEHGS